MILKEDIYSHAKKKTLYAPKGAKVRLIKQFDNVLIVEYKGDRFAVNKQKVVKDYDNRRI